MNIKFNVINKNKENFLFKIWAKFLKKIKMIVYAKLIKMKANKKCLNKKLAWET